MDTAHGKLLLSRSSGVYFVRPIPIGLGSSRLPQRRRFAKHIAVASLRDETSPGSGPLDVDSLDSFRARPSISGKPFYAEATCTCHMHKSRLGGRRRHLITVPHAANPWEASNGAVREPESKSGAGNSGREWGKKVVWDDDSQPGRSGKNQEDDEQARKQKWQAQWQRFRQALLGVAQTIKGKKAPPEESGAAGQTPELKNVISDVRRLGMSGILLGAISLLHLYAHGRLSPYADTVLDTLSLVWFVFMVLDMVLTSTTWVAGAQAFSLLMATCPSCGTVFYYSRDSFRGFMTCPKCFEEMRWDGSRFVRDRPRFSRVNYGHDAFGFEPEDPTPPKQKFLPVVDVDAKVSDK